MKQLFLVLLVVLGFTANVWALDCSNSAVRFPMSEIARKVQTNPEAADTLEGIHLFWIAWESYPESIELTRTALACLESQGVVEQFHIGNRVLWRGAR
ncbi:hypothetical protein ACES2I_10075 [Bdellovibrio bacteriovorus]|uniref:hypothetical protein n=1 Tax=Bdellovibrio bacteriovorus TaxID=959 RepID=UPI0035A65CEF